MEAAEYWQNFDYRRGWTGTNPGWYEVSIPYDEYGTQTFDKFYESIVDWLYENIDHPRRHVRWITLADTVKVRFRHERDYLLFVLRWS